MTAKNYYQPRRDFLHFRKLTNTGITTDYDTVFKFAEDYLNEYANWKRDVSIDVDSYTETELIEMFKDDNS